MSNQFAINSLFENRGKVLVIEAESLKQAAELKRWMLHAKDLEQRVASLHTELSRYKEREKVQGWADL
jgi:hypothetical protein